MKFRSVPPPSSRRFRTDDLDELRAFVVGTVGEHSRLVRGTGALGYDQAWLTGSETAVGWVGTDLGTLVRGAVREPTLHLDVPAGTTYRVGRRQHVAAANAVTFLAPDWTYTLDRPAGLSSAVGVSRRALEAELDRRDGASGPGRVLRTRPIELDATGRASLAQAIEELVSASDPAMGPSPLAHAEARMVAALADLLAERALTARGLEVAAVRMANLEAWIEANLESPISIGTLCEVAGVTERALQKRFELRRGMAPMRFVIERRLEAARRQLSLGAPGSDVTQVAIRLGFSHTGRFAALYRQVYGESPSQTLRRSRR